MCTCMCVWYMFMCTVCVKYKVCCINVRCVLCGVVYCVWYVCMQLCIVYVCVCSICYIYLCAMLHVYMCVLYSVECVGYISILCECVWYKGMI